VTIWTVVKQGFEELNWIPAHFLSHKLLAERQLKKRTIIGTLLSMFSPWFPKRGKRRNNQESGSAINATVSSFSSPK
jgi:hypothetical protein